MTELEIKQFFGKTYRAGKGGGLDTPCLIWCGRYTKKIPMLSFRGREYPVMRLMYELVYGVIPQDCWIKHLCNEWHCIEPAHIMAFLHGKDPNDANR